MIEMIPYSMGCSQVVRQWTLTPSFVGSIPTIPVSQYPSMFAIMNHELCKFSFLYAKYFYFIWFIKINKFIIT